MQKRTFLVYCSMTRRSAAWACCVIMSASSRIISLKPFENKVLVSANCLTCSRTTSMPRSSDALSYEVDHCRFHMLVRTNTPQEFVFDNQPHIFAGQPQELSKFSQFLEGRRIIGVEVYSSR